jgi:molecular chaperone GrpE (heat shock protein)
MNNPKNEPQSYKTNAVFSPQKNDEIMTVENNTKGKTIHIIKKRNRSPQINQSFQQSSPEAIKQNIKIESKNQDNEKEEIKAEKKEYKNNLKGPGRGISALRRINQKIENYKKRINTRKRRQTKSKNPQFKSSSQLKQKFGKHIFLKVKQNKSINNLPNVNKDFQNFDFIDNL